MKLYGISGLGADERVFKYLKLDVELIPIDWITPLAGEQLEDYAIRLSEKINIQEEFGIIGVSFGGLVAVEMSKKLKPAITILISSAETKSELRAIYRFVGKTKILKLFPSILFNPPRNVAAWLFGTQEKELLKQILADTDLKFAKWSIMQLTSWTNTEKLSNKVVRIEGTKDKMFPSTQKEKTFLISGGQHFMIVDRADEISEIINAEINVMPLILNTALEMLSSPTNDQSLADFVQWLDLQYSNDSTDNGKPKQLITRAIIAMGYHMLDNSNLRIEAAQNVLKTIKAASDYVMYPNASTYTEYYRSATNSYPYGAGEGCYSVTTLRKEGMKLCDAGTGCRSGAGSLMSNGLDDKELFESIASELIPWIKGEEDVVLKRAME